MRSAQREREARILAELAARGTVSVAHLAGELGVSEVTVRQQLSDLAKRGLLTRTHGGAQSTSAHTVLLRATQHETEKDRIAAAAAAMVRDGDTLMIEAGTTTAGLVKHLSARLGVRIVTNSTLVFAQARHQPGISVIMTGGNFHEPSESLVGPLAVRGVRDFHVRLAFVGTDGFTAEQGLTTQFAEGAEVIAAMAEQADETWLLADASKFGRAGFARVLPPSALAGVITDDSLPADEIEALRRDAGLAVHLA